MEYHVLGPFEVLDDVGNAVDVGSKQQRALLALLLANANRVLSTDRILEELWADDHHGKENTLWVYVSRLRAALEPASENRAKSQVLVTRDHGYSLAIDLDSLDSHRFENQVEFGRATMKDDPLRAAEVLSGAIEMWRGRAYEDFQYEEFAQREIARLEDLHLEATEDRIDADIRAGRHREVIGDLEALLTEHPLRERPVELLMVALYRSGRQADALRAFQRHKGKLGEELGVGPTPRLCRIEEQVLLHDPRLQPPSSLAEPVEPVRNPFKGLQSFTEADSDRFFGRDRLVSDVLRRLSQGTRLVTLVGASGSGKSSAVRAGVVPAVRKAGLGARDWLVAQIVPGAHPFTELEAGLLRAAFDGPDSLTELLDDSETGLLRAALRLLPESSSRLLLVIDQFEELFTLVESEAERSRFIRNLEVALNEPHARVAAVITLRADFYDRPLAHGTFATLLGEGVVNVVPLLPTELEVAAEQPARSAGVTIEPTLLAHLLSDVTGQVGGLPLFQYALTELFDRRVGSTLSADVYVEMGGVGGAITRRAEELFRGLSQEERLVCRQLFLRLVKIADDGSWTRRRVVASEITSIAQDVIRLQTVLDVFAAHRLLTFDRDSVTGSPTVEVAHEALLHVWERLNEWIEAGLDDVQRHARFVVALGEWETAGEKPDYLLSGDRLEDYRRWATSSTLHLTARERRYLDASVDLAERESQAEAERTARETKLDRLARRRFRELLFVGVVIVALVTGIVVAVVGGRPPRIVVVHGAAGDLGVNDLMLAGASSAEGIFEIEIERLHPLVDTVADLRELAETGANLVVLSNLFDRAVEEVAPQFPDVRFVSLDPVAVHIELPNITELHFRVEESSFLAGAAAALTTQTASVGFIGGFQDFPGERSRAGFEQGVHFENDEIEVISAYLGPLENPAVAAFESPELAHALATEMFRSGVDVIYHDAGASNVGIIQAARELATLEDPKWVIGSDVDQYQTARSPLDRRHILSSTVKRYDTAVVAAIEAFLDDELESGEVLLGLEDRAVELSLGGHLEEQGIQGSLKNLGGELMSGHITLFRHVETSPVWQHAPDVVVALKLSPEGCEVVDVQGGSRDGSRLFLSRGSVVRFDIANDLAGVGGLTLRHVPHDITVAQLRDEAVFGIPASFDTILGITLAEPGTSSSVSAIMTGSSFSPNCIDYEGQTPGGDTIPAAIVSPVR